MKKENLLAPKWWNPLFWLVVILAPLLGAVAGTVAGAFTGLLVGYERGLDKSDEYVRKMLAKL